MGFSTRIFIPDLPKRFNRTPSGKVIFYSYFAFFCILVLGYFNLSFFHLKTFNVIIITVACLCLAGTMVSGFMRLSEYENLNGHFDGTFEIDADCVKINETIYLLNTISAFKLGIQTYSGQSTGNSRYGPAYYQGTSNTLSFEHAGKTISLQFYIGSESEMEQLYYILIQIISFEKVPYRRELLNLIPEGYRYFPDFKNFIIKLLAERRISCTEGLLIIGYSSDAEAKEMRAKYCC